MASSKPTINSRFEFAKQKCKKIDEQPVIFCPNDVGKGKAVYDDGKDWIRKFEIGKNNLTAESEKNKVIIVLGETGSGKTTFINGLFNYILGVKYEDAHRFKLIVEESEDETRSVTRCITSYIIHHQPWFNTNCTITIIDTPGYGDTDGIDRDIEITEQIKKLFKSGPPAGIDSISAVGFVAKANVTRLTHPQKYVFSSVLQLFGNDMEENIFVLASFPPPGKKKPHLLEALDKEQIKYRDYFKLDLGQLYDEPDEDDDSGEKAWKAACTNFASFLLSVDTVKPKSLTMTKEVLENRAMLEEAMENIETNIMDGINALEELAIKEKVIEQHKKDIDNKKSFNFDINEHWVVAKPLSKAYEAVNCRICKLTCTQGPSDDITGKKNWLFQTGRCKRCPKKCASAVHDTENKIYSIETRRVTTNTDDLMKLYEKEEGKKKGKKTKLKAEDVIRLLNAEFDNAKRATLKNVTAAKQCIEKLQKIALRPKPMSVTQYIDVLIENQKMKADTDFAQRLELLLKLKEFAEKRDALFEGVDIFECMIPQCVIETREQGGMIAFFKRWLPGS